MAPEIEESAAVKDDAATGAPTPRSTVLIVDSDASSLEFMERALSQAGLKVVATTQIGGSQGQRVCSIYAKTSTSS